MKRKRTAKRPLPKEKRLLRVIFALVDAIEECVPAEYQDAVADRFAALTRTEADG